jgi:surfactin synthase thioesterase subunit
MPPETSLYGVQYPGRGDRLGEPAVEAVREMSACVAAELLRAAPAPYALFGHSLGGPGRLRDRGPAPRPRQALQPPLRLRLGGADPESAAHDELRELMLPALRADIRASELYRPTTPPHPPRPCPVRCYHGKDDPTHFTAWADTTTGPFTTHLHPGGHFHPTGNPTDLVTDVTSHLTR